ncbi:MAG: D-alanyl-D-alanine carboxypeptidase [Holosporales bacterium]|nr:D-alanyl-D-alanine carboxypeptidase [Holosporales bacterium]
MSKSILTLVVCVLAAWSLSWACTANATPKYSAVVIDADSGQVLYEENAQEQVCPASLTKMMTLLLVFDALKSGKLSLDQKIRISRRASMQSPSKLGLRAGTRISVRDAMLALATKSANDIAVALAEAVGKTEGNFARLMTQKARSIGMRNTTFRNASGLFARNQKTTAMDMAKLSKHLIRKYPEQYKLFSTKVFTYYGWSHRNHNGLLWFNRGGLRYDGIKTGYIEQSGFNLAASAVKDGRRMIAVVMGGKTRKERDSRVNLLLQAAFDGQFWSKGHKIEGYNKGPRLKADPITELISVSTRPPVSKPEDLEDHNLRKIPRPSKRILYIKGKGKRGLYRRHLPQKSI